MDIEKRLLAFFSEEGLPLEGNFLVAASGGPDSMALLDLMRRLPGDFQLYAAHLDHQLRADSQKESQVLRAYCHKYQLPLYESVWPKSLHPESGLEAAARDYRYNFLFEVARQVKADYLLTAHHGDDLLENILLKLVRSGIPREMNSLKPVSQRGQVKLVRPLLAVGKADLLAYAEKQGLEYVEDETNFVGITARNRLRQEVVPLLKKESPDLLENAWRFSREMTVEEDYFAQAAGKLPEPESFFGGWRIPKAAGQAESELVKAYLENFIQKKYNKRVQLDRTLLANRQSQEKGGLHLCFYQGHYWLYPVKQPAPSPLEEVVAGQPFFFRGNCYLLSEEKLEESPLAEISFPGKLSAGSLPSGQRLLLKDGRRTKSKKLFSAAGIPLALRGNCLSLFAGQEAVYVAGCYQQAVKEGKGLLYLYQVKTCKKGR